MHKRIYRFKFQICQQFYEYIVLFVETPRKFITASMAIKYIVLFVETPRKFITGVSTNKTIYFIAMQTYKELIL